MPTIFDTAYSLPDGRAFSEPLRIYTGILGQIGDIIMFTPTVRRIKELFPRSVLTFAVSARYREAGELVAGLPYVDRLFISELYFERLTEDRFGPWHLGWPADLRGDDEVAEQRMHDVILETRPRHRRMPWWNFAHMTAELAHMVGVPGPIEPRTEICIPSDVQIPTEAIGRLVLHNDPNIDPRKAWPWEYVVELVQRIGPGKVVLLGNPGTAVPGAFDFRGRTTLAQAAKIIASARCFLGIESGLMCIAGSLQAPTIGLFGTVYVPAYEAVHPHNPRAIYLQAEGALDGIPPQAVLDALTYLMSETGSRASAAVVRLSGKTSN